MLSYNTYYEVKTWRYYRIYYHIIHTKTTWRYYRTRYILSYHTYEDNMALFSYQVYIAISYIRSQHGVIIVPGKYIHIIRNEHGVIVEPGIYYHIIHTYEVNMALLSYIDLIT